MRLVNAGCDRTLKSIYPCMVSSQIWSGFSFQVVGDDLLMSNPKRIERAVQEAACNALLLKVTSNK